MAALVLSRIDGAVGESAGDGFLESRCSESMSPRLVESVREQDALAAIRAGRRARARLWPGWRRRPATLVNPFGWRLHAHIYRYLGDRYLMDRIDEFKSPNFHGWAERCFAAILMLTLMALASNRNKLRLSHLLVRYWRCMPGLFVAQSSSFFDAAGTGGWSNSLGEHCRTEG